MAKAQNVGAVTRSVGATALGTAAMLAMVGCGEEPLRYVDGTSAEVKMMDEPIECYDKSYSAHVATEGMNPASLEYPPIESIPLLESNYVLCNETKVYVHLGSADAISNTEWYYRIENLQVNSNGTCTFKKDGKVESTECLEVPIYGSDFTEFLENEISDDVVGVWSGKVTPNYGRSDDAYYELANIEPQSEYSGTDLAIIDPE